MNIFLTLPKGTSFILGKYDYNTLDTPELPEDLKNIEWESFNLAEYINLNKE